MILISLTTEAGVGRRVFQCNVLAGWTAPPFRSIWKKEVRSLKKKKKPKQFVICCNHQTEDPGVQWCFCCGAHNSHLCCSENCPHRHHCGCTDGLDWSTLNKASVHTVHTRGHSNVGRRQKPTVCLRGWRSSPFLDAVQVEDVEAALAAPNWSHESDDVAADHALVFLSRQLFYQTPYGRQRQVKTVVLTTTGFTAKAAKLTLNFI